MKSFGIDLMIAPALFFHAVPLRRHALRGLQQPRPRLAAGVPGRCAQRQTVGKFRMKPLATKAAACALAFQAWSFHAVPG